MTTGDSVRATPLRPGARVRVADPATILATLDSDGRLDGLPFMPEMLRWCGETLPVAARADKTCDTVTFNGTRRMNAAVHLGGDTRCDGSGHGGCQAGCLLFWKEEWLLPANPTTPGTAATAADAAAAGHAPDEEAAAALAPTTRGTVDGQERFYCQATEMLDATRPLPWWTPGQYVRDVRSGNVGLPRLGLGLAVWAFNMYQALSKRVLPKRLHFRGGKWYPFIIGTAGREVTGQLNLQPGETVEVRSREDILATLDETGRNRGLTFDGEMLRYCGRRFRVLRRIEKIIDERTGRMLRLPRDCIVLAGAVCEGAYHLFCPRAVYPYWREVWLRRVDGSSERPTTDATVSSAPAPAPLERR